MKDYKQVTESVFRKSEERLRKLEKRRSNIRRTVFALSGMCAVLLIGVGVWKNADLRNASRNNFRGDSGIITSTDPTDFSTTNVTTTADATTVYTTQPTTTVLTTSVGTAYTSTTSDTHTTTNSVTVTNDEGTVTTAAKTSQVTVTTNATTSASTTATCIKTSVSTAVTEVTTDVNTEIATSSENYPATTAVATTSVSPSLEPYIFVYNGNTYKKILDDIEYDGEYIDSIKVDNINASSGSVTLNLYGIIGIPSDNILLVRCENETEKYLYSNQNYTPATLQTLFSDIGLAKQWELTDYWCDDDYSYNEDGKFIEKLLRLPDARILNQPLEYETVSGFYIACKAINSWWLDIYFTDNGHILVMSFTGDYYFYVGTDTVNSIITKGRQH